MAKKTIKNKIRPSIHFKVAQKLYEEKGQSAVFAYANKHKIGYEFCKPCDTDSPQVKHICLVCGSSTSVRRAASDGWKLSGANS